MVKRTEEAIVKTLCYSDIFEFPLTKEELWRFLIADKPQSFQTVEKTVENIETVDKKDGFCFLKGRKKLVAIRKKRERESKRKLVKVNLALKILSFIPTVFLIGISGSLSMNNAEQKDDIDIFVICKKNSIWTTRLSVLFLLELMGVRRKRNDKNPKDKICLNMIVTEDNLRINKHTLYTAHEVAQLFVVFERKNMSDRFLNANKWVLRYLPNAFKSTPLRKSIVSRTFKHGLAIEFIARNIQRWYMRSHRTTETISDSLLAFHPHNNENWILKEYNRKIKKYV